MTFGEGDPSSNTLSISSPADLLGHRQGALHPTHPTFRGQGPTLYFPPSFPGPPKKEENQQKSNVNDTIPRLISGFLPPGGAWACSKLPSPPLLLPTLVKRGQETREQ